jgi:hypothetical protein
MFHRQNVASLHVPDLHPTAMYLVYLPKGATTRYLQYLVALVYLSLHLVIRLGLAQPHSYYIKYQSVYQY